MTDLHTRCAKLLELPEGWDSYGAVRIRCEAVTAALRLVDEVRRCDPHVVPRSDGGVQLEWPSLDLEIVIGPDGKVSYD